MNTPTHLIVAAALLSKRGKPNCNRAVLLGALAPDFSMFVFYLYVKVFTQATSKEIWGTLYWSEPWQTFGAISNSVPIAVAILVFGLWQKRAAVTVFAGAMLTHAALDFPVHADDAHRHFWPLTDWRYQSPVSYWDPSHHGVIGSSLELILLVIAIIVLWKRFPALWVHGLLMAVGGLYFGMRAYFYMAFGS